jgi:predicted CoA-substrate-specific enzyme activase
MPENQIYCGVDVGTSATKVVLLNSDSEMVGLQVAKSGANAADVACNLRDTILANLNLDKSAIVKTCSTGYARDDVGFADFTRTEISCHSKGCLLYFEGPITIVDIGGQDNKIIRLNEQGKRTSFKLNRKCAAGTGSFLEEIASLLEIDLDEMNEYAGKSESPVRLGSFCTVFTKTEILTNFRRGDRIADLAAGAFESVMRRIIEMDPLDGDVVLTGGVVAHNPCMKAVFEKGLGKPVKISPNPQFTGAIGAALYALQE